VVTAALRQTVASREQDRVPGHSNSKGLRVDPRGLLTVADKRIDFALLEALAGESVLSACQFDRRLFFELCKFAALLEVTEIASHHPLDGKLVITAFFEASTRTRLSFESAVLRLDGKVVSVPDGRVTGTAKGETLEDIGEMFNTYGDLVVMRHPDTDAVARVRKNLTLPLINAGNGSGEHPTQALLDWYTLLKWRPALAQPEVAERDRIHLGIIGTPGSMRSVKSFLLLTLLFPQAIRKVTVVSEMADPHGAALASALAESPITVETTHDVASVISDLDVVYMNSIAFLGDSYKTLDSRFKLTIESPLKPECVILHPFARRKELDVRLDPTPHNLYFAQAASAVFLRQALLICLLGRIPALPPSVLLLTN
jgi:aspartate carbamoyltransferase catalytic subunit